MPGQILASCLSATEYGGYKKCKTHQDGNTSACTLRENEQEQKEELETTHGTLNLTIEDCEVHDDGQGFWRKRQRVCVPW